jgi:hypothetical protein
VGETPWRFKSSHPHASDEQELPSVSTPASPQSVHKRAHKWSIPGWRLGFARACLALSLGDVFDPDDPLGVWICTLGIAFNDVIYSNVRVLDAERVWERFYAWGVAISHFNEAALHLERGRGIDGVLEFIKSDREVEKGYEDTLRKYADLRGLTHRFREWANGRCASSPRARR